MGKAKVYTRDGSEHEVEINSEGDAQWVDDLPFDSEDVTRTVVADD